MLLPGGVEPIDNAEAIFDKTGAKLKGHFLLTSGRHSPTYWEKFRILEQPKYTQQLGAMIADRFARENIQRVAGPTTGGIILAHEVAKQLGVGAIYAEKEGAGRTLRRGFAITPGERVLVVDDVLTTGKSIRETMAAVSGQGGKVIGIGVLVDRSEEEMDFGVPFFSCFRSPKIPTYAPAECPQCAKGVPLTRPGSSQNPKG